MNSAKKYKLYLFDLDGTLLDSDEMLIKTFHELYKLYKPSDFIIDDNHILSFSGPQISETMQNEFPEKDLDFMLAEWKRLSPGYYEQTAKLYEGAEDLLRLMKNKGIKFGIITNKHRYATDFALKLMGLDDLDIFCICADEVSKLKPDGEGIEKAMQHFGIENKDEVVYIGDTIYDFLTAKNANVNFGFVTWSPRVLPNFCHPDLKIRSYAEFAGDFE